MTCDGCGHDTSDYVIFHGRYYCKDCATNKKAAEPVDGSTAVYHQDPSTIGASTCILPTPTTLLQTASTT